MLTAPLLPPDSIRGKQTLKPASVVPKNRTPRHDAWVEVDNFKKVPADSHP
jgi:hypothetical protein